MVLQVAKDVGRRGWQTHEHTAQGELPVGTSSRWPGEPPIQEAKKSGDYFRSQNMCSHTDQNKIGRHHHVSAYVFILDLSYRGAIVSQSELRNIMNYDTCGRYFVCLLHTTIASLHVTITLIVKYFKSPLLAVHIITLPTLRIAF